MIESIAYSEDQTEKALLEQYFRREAALAGNEEWHWCFAGDRRTLREHLGGVQILDLGCLAVTGQRDIADAEEMRRRFGEMMLMLVADSRISPMKYLKPSVMPTSLLIRPWKEEELKQVVHEFVSAFLDTREGDVPEQNYVIETKDGRTFLPLGKISCFEARQKKICIRVEAVEYEAYDTIEHLAGTLPDEFVRCHRSYIVNRKKIVRINMSENLICLEDGTCVPISRSYRAKVRTL